LQRGVPKNVFGKKRNSPNPGRNGPTVLAGSTVVHGDVFCQDHLVIEGKVKGMAVADRVLIKPKGLVKGSVACRSLLVEPGGLVDGPVKVLDSPLPTGEPE
jgi:cytoskeletal protein CcmA (bactofilin family)